MTQHIANQEEDIDGLEQDCSISSALAMKLHCSCTNPSIYNSKWVCFDHQVIHNNTTNQLDKRNISHSMLINNRWTAHYQLAHIRQKRLDTLPKVNLPLNILNCFEEKWIYKCIFCTNKTHVVEAFLHGHQGLYSESGRMSYHKISWGLEAVRFRFRLLQLLYAAEMPVKFQIIITSNLVASRLSNWIISLKTQFSLKKYLNMLSATWWLFSLGHNVLKISSPEVHLSDRW